MARQKQKTNIDIRLMTWHRSIKNADGLNISVSATWASARTAKKVKK